MKTLTYGPYTIELFTEKMCQGIIYAVMDQQDAKETWPLLNGHNLALAAISGVDWNRELSQVRTVISQDRAKPLLRESAGNH